MPSAVCTVRLEFTVKVKILQSSLTSDPPKNGRLQTMKITDTSMEIDRETREPGVTRVPRSSENSMYF